LAALLLAAISVAVTLSLIDYPLGVAWDELVKLRGVRTGRYAYYRPLIDLAQAAALVVHPADLPNWSGCLALWPAASWCSPPSAWHGSCCPTCQP